MTPPHPARFLADLEAKPVALARLAASRDVRDAISRVPGDVRRVLLLGMGSSRYAAEVAALRLRERGVQAVAELASTRRGSPPGRDLLVVAISASGTSSETLAALERHAGRSRSLAITNDPGSPVVGLADDWLPLEAGPEFGGVACRSFQHTGLVLRALEDQLTGAPDGLPELCARVAEASVDLLDRREAWLPPLSEALDGPDGVYVLAPAERSSSAAQSALMIREGPRRAATGCETGDWSHVDVYLTKTLDYRALFFAGSPWDGAALEWLQSRGSGVVGVGADVDGSSLSVRFRGDDDEDVALHAEVLVAELLAARWWAREHGLIGRR